MGYLQGMEELYLGPPKTNPSSGREDDLNPRPPDYKSSALPLGHARLSVGRALHRYRRSHGFESHSGITVFFFQDLIS